MARTARKHSDSGVYHVILRGVNKQQIFECTEDYQRFLNILRTLTVQEQDESVHRSKPNCVVYGDPRSNHEAHILILCILLQSQVWTNRTSLSGAIQEPASWRLGVFPHTASVYPSKPTQTSSGHLPPRIQMEQLA